MHLLKLQTIRKFLYTPIRLKIILKGDTIKVMDRVDFIEQNEFHIKSRKLFGEPTTPTMISILLKTGLVRNEKQALAILLFVVGLTLSATGFLMYSRTHTNSNVVVDQNGQTYTFNEYIELVRIGKDPLLPK